MRELRGAALIVCMGVFLSGCSVLMAARQPDYKDLSFLKEGVARERVIAELGIPAATEKDPEGRAVEIFRFRQGYGTGNKTARMIGHGVADVFTLGLWEVIGTPSEVVFDGKDIAIKITYDQDSKVKEIVYLKGEPRKV